MMFKNVIVPILTIFVINNLTCTGGAFAGKVLHYPPGNYQKRKDYIYTASATTMCMNWCCDRTLFVLSIEDKSGTSYIYKQMKLNGRAWGILSYEWTVFDTLIISLNVDMLECWRTWDTTKYIGGKIKRERARETKLIKSDTLDFLFVYDRFKKKFYKAKTSKK